MRSSSPTAEVGGSHMDNMSLNAENLDLRVGRSVYLLSASAD